MLISVIDTPSVWSYITVMAYKMPLGGASTASVQFSLRELHGHHTGENQRGGESLLEVERFAKECDATCKCADG